MYVILVLPGHPLLAWTVRAWLAAPKPAAAASEANQSFEPWGTSSVPEEPTRYKTSGPPTERSVATMLPRLGSTRGDSRGLEGTTAWLEREDRQRLSARSPLPSLTYKITWFGFESRAIRADSCNCRFPPNIISNAVWLYHRFCNRREGPTVASHSLDHRGGVHVRAAKRRWASRAELGGESSR